MLAVSEALTGLFYNTIVIARSSGCMASRRPNGTPSVDEMR
jgi:hypothetical protein